MEYFNIDEFSEREKENIITTASDTNKQKGFYEKFRAKIDDYIEKHPNAKYLNLIMMFPDFFHLMCKLYGDDRVPTKNKLFLGCAIAYCISPIDILPDIIPGGFTDDAVIIIKTLSDLIKQVDNNIICEHWLGEENIIKTIEDLAEITSDFLNKDNIGNKISSFIDSFKHKK